MNIKLFSGTFVLVMVLTILAGCAKSGLSPATYQGQAPTYIIGPGDTVNIFVWGNEELSSSVPVRPDGKITTPLVEDIQASGQTSTQLARRMEQELKRYIKNPIVTVIVTGFVGRFNEQIRVVGAAQKPQAIPYKENMTLLDVMIAVGGLNDYASGNRSKLIRKTGEKQVVYDVKIKDLVKKGDITANVDVLPGDILIIPEAWF